MKLSHSKIDKYNSCKRLYKYHYIDYIRTELLGSALFFGISIDKAVNFLLEQKIKDPNCIPDIKQAESIFHKHFNEATYNNETIDIPNSLKTVYFASDYDQDLLDETDIQTLQNKFPVYELGNPLEIMSTLKKCIKQDGFKSLDDTDKLFYNYACWLSLRNKGIMMIKAYIDDILPEIEKVISVQKTINITNDDGDVIGGDADFICKFKDDNNVYIADNKTSSKPYTKESVKKSQQLTIYCESENINNAAYCVLNKKVRKTKVKTCTICGNVTTGSELTCKVGGTGKNRCGGSFDVVVKLSIDTQIIKDSINEDQKDTVFDKISNTLYNIRCEDYSKNDKKDCFLFGRKCDYFDKCWKDSTCMEGLVNLKD